MTELTLRPYQAECIEAMNAEQTQRAGVILPTGAGKTVIFAGYARQWRERGGSAVGDGVLVLAHRDELIRQAVAKLRAAAPYMGIGVVKAERQEINRPIVVASVASLARNPKRRAAVLKRRGLIVVDEAHHATAPSYLTVLREAGCYEPASGVQAFGFTATMSRADGAALGQVWQNITFERGMREMIHDGYLVPPRGRRVYVEDLDLSRVRVSGGDFRKEDLGEALEQSLAPETIAKAYREHAADRQGLIFTPTVATAELIAEAMRVEGFTCVAVYGDMDKTARQRAVDDFMAGRVQVLANCMVFTEGTDLPPASVAVIARPTKSQSLYIQMVGRALRLWPGKDDALVLDVTGASTKHSLMANVDLFGERDGDEQEKREREYWCLECSCDDWDRQLGSVCDVCGHEHRPPAEAPDADAVAFDDIEGYAVGELRDVEVDLFHGSASIWLRTAAGVRYIPAGARYIVLLKADPAVYGPGCFDVVEMNRTVRGSSYVAQGVPDLGYAMAHAEGALTPAELATGRRERSWRMLRPNDNQRRYATALNIAVPRDVTRGELSNMIDAKLATRRIDPYLYPYMY